MSEPCIFGVSGRRAACKKHLFRIPVFRPCRAAGCHGSRTGFTLIELLVVLVILTVVIGISATSIPSFSSPRQLLRTDARELLSLLQDARQSAMSQKMKIDVCVSPETGTVRAIETACAQRLAVVGASFFDNESMDTNCYMRTVSFGEDIVLAVFAAGDIAEVVKAESDPFGTSDEPCQPSAGESVALTFTYFGGASGGGISLIRKNARLDIACDILTGEPEIVTLRTTGNER